MADNRGRGPNDFRGRDGRRRREPPIIDASATEVPVDPTQPAAEPTAPEVAPAEPAAVPATPVEPGPGAEPAAVEAAIPADPPAAVPGSEPAAVEAATPAAPPAAMPGDEGHRPTDEAPNADPVLFGGMRRDPAARPEPVDPGPAPAAPPEGDEPSAAEPAIDGPMRVPEPAATAAVPPPVPAAAGGGAAPWLLTLSTLVLLGALAWVLYTEPQRGGGASALADLRTKVAALEARPDPSQIQGGVADINKRLGAADVDRANLAKSVAALNARLDGIARQAEGAAATAGAAQSDANRPAPTGDAAPATTGALAALASKVDALDGRIGAVAGDQTKTARAVADLPKPVPPDFGPTEAKIAALDGSVGGKVASLDARLTALDGKVNGTDARLNGFDAKVNAVDGKVNNFDARANAIDARANGLEGKLNGEDEALGRLKGTVDGLLPLTAATAALDGRVAKVEGQLAAPKDGARVTEARAVGSADESRATPIAVVGQSLGRAAADGRPYAPELDALKALGVEPDALAKLQPYAAKGAPSVGTLRAQWNAVAPDVLATVRPSETGSALDRFAAGARALVQVRQVGAIPGDDPGAVVSRIGAALDAGDAPGALAAWDGLPAAGKDRSKDWAAAARGRVDAIAAARGIVDRAIATLGRTKG